MLQNLGSTLDAVAHLCVFLGKTVNAVSHLGALGPSSLPLVVVQSDERHANRNASVLEWYLAQRRRLIQKFWLGGARVKFLWRYIDDVVVMTSLCWCYINDVVVMASQPVWKIKNWPNHATSGHQYRRLRARASAEIFPGGEPTKKKTEN